MKNEADVRLREEIKKLHRNVYANFAKRLDLGMLRKGLSANALARLAGLHFTTISYYRNGKRYPGLGVIVQLSLILECSVDWLLGLTPDDTFGRE